MPRNSYPIGSLWISHDMSRGRTYVFRVVGRGTSGGNPNNKRCDVYEISWNINNQIEDPRQNVYSHKHLKTKLVKVDFSFQELLGKLKTHQNMKKVQAERISLLGIPYDVNNPEWASYINAEAGFYAVLHELQAIGRTHDHRSSTQH